MPFRSKSRPGVWLGQVKHEGKIYRATFLNRREAQEWEIEKRKALEAASQAQIPTAMDLVSFFTRYLEDADLRFSRKTFEEKKSLTHRFLEMWGNMLVSDVTPDMIHRYLNSQAEQRSANASNRDRKNLMAVWTWGINLFDLDSNPVRKIKQLPHDREPQYTPSTEEVLRVLAVATR